MLNINLTQNNEIINYVRLTLKYEYVKF